MKWVDQALEEAAEEFVESCKKYIYDLNMHVAAIAYKHLPKDQMKSFTDEFISTLKYKNLHVWNIPLQYELVTPIKIYGYDLEMAMDNLRKEIAKNEPLMVFAIYIQPDDDKICIKLFKTAR